MLRNLTFACTLIAAALAAPLPITAAAATRSTSSVDDDGASFDPMVVYEEHGGRELAEETEETDGRKLAEVTNGAAATKKKVAGASGPGQMGVSSLRYKLSQSYCPTADATEKGLLACKNQELGHRVRSAKDEAAKKALVDERKALYAEAAKKSDADKKKAAADHKTMYSKAYGKYCAGAKSATDVCTNELMKKMYSGAKAIGGKKAKKKKD